MIIAAPRSPRPHLSECIHEGARLPPLGTLHRAEPDSLACGGPGRDNGRVAPQLCAKTKRGSPRRVDPGDSEGSLLSRPSRSRATEHLASAHTCARDRRVVYARLQQAPHEDTPSAPDLARPPELVVRAVSSRVHALDAPCEAGDGPRERTWDSGSGSVRSARSHCNCSQRATAWKGPRSCARVGARARSHPDVSSAPPDSSTDAPSRTSRHRGSIGETVVQ